VSDSCGTCMFKRRATGNTVAICVWCQKALYANCERLAANLTIAAALCRSFELGADRGYASCPCDGIRDDFYYKTLARFWRPGSGEKA
jgi:hypothetical protein